MHDMIYFATAASAAGEPHPLMSFLPLIVMFVIFYVLLIRPQQKRKKEQTTFVENLQKNQEVVTAGGMHGTIVQVKEATVILRIADNVRIEVDKPSISRSKKA